MAEQLFSISDVANFMNTDAALRGELNAYVAGHREHPAHSAWISSLHNNGEVKTSNLVALLKKADAAQGARDGKTSFLEIDRYITVSAVEKSGKLHNPYVLSLLKHSLKRFAERNGMPVDINPLKGMKLNSTVFTFRHGDSVPSSRGEVCGDPVRCALKENGLAPGADAKVRESAQKWIAMNTELLSEKMRAGKVLIVTSPFSRTIDTSNVIADELKMKFGSAPTIIEEWGIRERFFGDFEALRNSKDLYENAWRHDPEYDAGPKLDKAWGIESPDDVALRATTTLAKYDSDYGDCVILYVAHNDTLKIMEAALRGLPLSKHEDKSCDPKATNCVKSNATAEWRHVNPFLR